MSDGSSGLVHTQCLVNEDLKDCTPIIPKNSQKHAINIATSMSCGIADLQAASMVVVPAVRLHKRKILKQLKDRNSVI